MDELLTKFHPHFDKALQDLDYSESVYLGMMLSAHFMSINIENLPTRKAVKENIQLTNEIAKALTKERKKEG